MTSFENARILIGYARVSTDDQSLSLQRDALSKAGCKRIFTDTASGAPTQRPGLADALSHLRKGDSLVVWKLDRLGRSVRIILPNFLTVRRTFLGAARFRSTLLIPCPIVI